MFLVEIIRFSVKRSRKQMLVVVVVAATTGIGVHDGRQIMGLVVVIIIVVIIVMRVWHFLFERRRRSIVLLSRRLELVETVIFSSTSSRFCGSKTFVTTTQSSFVWFGRLAIFGIVCIYSNHIFLL